MTLCESITEFSMWAIAASPMLVTTPIMVCGNESTNFTNQSGYMPGHMAPTPSPRTRPSAFELCAPPPRKRLSFFRCRYDSTRMLVNFVVTGHRSKIMGIFPNR